MLVWDLVQVSWESVQVGDLVEVGGYSAVEPLEAEQAELGEEFVVWDKDVAHKTVCASKNED